jgi:hypothetical protein
MSSTIQNIIDLAKKLVPVLAGAAGMPWLDAAVSAGQAVLGLIDGVKEAGHDTQGELDSTRDELEAAVNAHVDRTIGDLRGGQ